MWTLHRQRSLTPIIQIVPFRARQLERIARIERASFGKEAWPRTYFLELHRDCRDFFFVAKISRRIAGYAVACTESPNAEIVSLAVDPDYRRRGVASALMRHVLRELRTARLPRVDLMVRIGNTGAVRLYRSLGFRRVRAVPGYYEDGGDGILMTRALQ